MANITGTDGNDTLDGTNDADTINGLGGNDTISGGFGDDTIDGGAGDDEITDIQGGGTILGGLGNDRIWLSANDPAGAGRLADGGDGDDTLFFQGDGGTLTTLEGGAGADFFHLRADGGSFALGLGADQDRVYFSPFFNLDLSVQFTITDFAAGAGGDRLEFAEFILMAGSNWDGSGNPFATGHVRVVQDGADARVEIDLDGGGDDFLTLVTLEGVTAAALTAENLDGFPPDGSAAQGITITGTGADEVLRGSNGADTVQGLAGDDTLYGLAGDDTLEGGDGFDSIEGGGGHDVIRGGDGSHDILLGGHGDDELYSGDEGGVLRGDEGNDLIVGGDGVNNIAGGNGLDTIVGGASLDLIAVSDADIVDGGGSADNVSFDFRFLGEGISVDLTAMWGGGAGTIGLGSIRSVEVIEYFYGSEFGDVFIAGAGLTEGLTDIVGYGGGDRLEGGGGDDRVGGGEGDDLLFGHAGADMLNGEAGNDTLEGGDHDDDLYGEEGNDLVHGGEGADELFGWYGDDELWGDAGNDKLQGGPGSDTLHGGDGDDELTTTPGAFATMFGDAGDDLFLLDTAADVDGGAGSDLLLIYFAQGAERLDLDLTNVWTGGVGRIGAGEVRAIEGFLSGIAGSFLDDSIIIGEALTAGVGISGGIGADLIAGGGGGDSLSGEQGNDSLKGGGGDDFLQGGIGNDLLIGGLGADDLRGGAGDDSYRIEDSLDVVQEGAGAGSDSVYASLSFTLRDGVHVEALATTNAAGTGVIDLTGNGFNNSLYGNAGANRLIGNAGADSLSGLGGNDTLDGGVGIDHLRGGAGADSFRFMAGLDGVANVDRILDFSVPDDVILIENAVFIGINGGALAVGAFRIGSAAQDGDDRIIYNSATGALFFDADGNGAGAQVQFATLQAGLPLTSADFVVI